MTNAKKIEKLFAVLASECEQYERLAHAYHESQKIRADLERQLGLARHEMDTVAPLARTLLLVARDDAVPKAGPAVAVALYATTRDLVDAVDKLRKSLGEPCKSAS
jgi:hypothetical protein